MRTAKKVITAIACVLLAVILAGLCVQVFAPNGNKVTDWFNSAKNNGVYLLLTQDENNDWKTSDEVKLDIKSGGKFVLYEKDGEKVTSYNGTYEQEKGKGYITAKLPEFDEEKNDYFLYIVFGEMNEMYVYENPADETYSMVFLKEKKKVTKELVNKLNGVTEETETAVSTLSVSNIQADGGIMLYSAPRLMSANVPAAQAENGVTVTVTDAFEGASYEWSLSGISNPQNYVTLSSTTGESITVSAKAAFGQQITLTCTGKYGGETFATATCTLDYAKRLTGLTNSVNLSSYATPKSAGNYVLSYTPSYSVYTVDTTYYFEWSCTYNSSATFTTSEQLTFKGFIEKYFNRLNSSDLGGNGMSTGSILVSNWDNSLMQNQLLQMLSSFGGHTVTIKAINANNSADYKVTSFTFPEVWRAATASVTLSDSNVIL